MDLKHSNNEQYKRVWKIFVTGSWRFLATIYNSNLAVMNLEKITFQNLYFRRRPTANKTVILINSIDLNKIAGKN